MPQLVNKECAVCHERIASVVDTEFCRMCGNPVHRMCKPDEASGSLGHCPQCGGDTSGATAMSSRLAPVGAGFAAGAADGHY